MIKRFALSLLKLMLLRILLLTPYTHSSNLELKWFLVTTNRGFFQTVFIHSSSKQGNPPFFDTSNSLFFLIFFIYEMIKRFVLSLLNLMLLRILLLTPYTHSSNLELKWFLVSAYLAESLCICALSLLRFNMLLPPRDSRQLGVSTCVCETMPNIDELTIHGSSLSHHRAQAFTNTKHFQFI
jgi:hypothetical protein